MEVRDLLNKYEYDGDNVPVIKRIIAQKLEGDADAEKAILT